MSSSKEVIEDINILDFTRAGMYTYGTMVNEERAAPSYVDGFKTVARRCLWSLNSFPRTKDDKGHKTAKIVGDVLGNYHPHGDQPVVTTLETMVHMPMSPVLGKGNWGTVTDGAAGMRYTNIGLSKYGETFLRSDYLAVSHMIPNYDDSKKEPMVLPALLPNLLLNGSTGIGVGIRNPEIPSYELSGLCSIMTRLLDGEKLTPKDYVKTLKFTSAFGGRLVASKENRDALLAFYESHRGAVEFEVPLEYNEATRTLRWDEFPMGISVDNAVDRLRALSIKKGKERIPVVARVLNTTSKKGVSYEIEVRKGLTADQHEIALSLIQKELTARRQFTITVTDRQPTEKGCDISLLNLSVPQFCVKWLKWRIELESKRLDYRIQLEKNRIAYLKLMLRAIDALDIIMAALRKEDPDSYLVKHMKITEEEAKTILDLKVRQLSKLDQSKVTATMKEHLEELRNFEKQRASPKKVVREFLAKFVK